MSSCRAREADRALTLPQFHAIGLQPELELSECQPPGPRENRANGLRALQRARGSDMLFIEDDIDLAPDFPLFLDMARQADKLTWLYVNDVDYRVRGMYGTVLWAMIERRQAIPRGLINPLTLSGLWGGQCVYIPRRHVDGILAYNEPVDCAFDDLLVRYAQNTRVEVRIAIPHPVQHRHSRAARQPDAPSRIKRSASFDLERASE